MARRSPGVPATFWSDLQHRTRLEWVVVTAILTLLTAALSLLSQPTGLQRLDLTLYDAALSSLAPHPASPDIVIVAIDDGSIARIGHWPWRRATHAALLDRLQQARAVAMDVMFTDPHPDYPQDDILLAQALARHGRVVLPKALAPDTTLAPLPRLAQAAARLGYINIWPDADGIIRAMRPTATDHQGLPQDHLTLALMETAGHADSAARLRAAPSGPRRIPYAGPPGHFTLVPYAAVLQGDIAPEAFQDKLVLVGSWGTGLGDTFPTPLSRHGIPMSGVEILANSLQSGLEDRWIRTPDRWTTALLAALPVLAVCLLVRRRSPRQALFIAAGALVIVLALNWLLLHAALAWMPVAASLIGILLCYPVWSWRNQEVALRHIDQELRKLKQEQAALGDDLAPAQAAHDRSLPARILLLHGAIDALRHAQHEREETLRFLSHDMRSPQNSILALAQLQQVPDTALPQDELLARIEQYANRTLGLVDGFVQLARAESMALQAQPLNLADLLMDAADAAWAIGQQRHITVHCDDLPDDAFIQGDQPLLTRALGNLIDNGMKYSSDQTQIHCRLARDGADWVVRITDQGRGIPAAKLQTIFLPFTRADEHIQGNPSGTGLGLAFVQTIISRHGGSIHAESREGEGSTFTIRLPAIPVPA